MILVAALAVAGLVGIVAAFCYFSARGNPARGGRARGRAAARTSSAGRPPRSAAGRGNWLRRADVGEDLWPEEAFGGMTDEQFWDNLSSDRPLATHNPVGSVSSRRRGSPGRRGGGEDPLTSAAYPLRDGRVADGHSYRTSRRARDLTPEQYAAAASQDTQAFSVADTEAARSGTPARRRHGLPPADAGPLRAGGYGDGRQRDGRMRPDRADLTRMPGTDSPGGRRGRPATT
ncbi:MAG: hypothetical protein JO132_20525 [Streptosporangiaceae bacterium]|nr:hypothetical protein [Streptosporangiaceae bacterium]